jgi:glycosyltransferase involved in cell wall biosynthesis
MKNISIGIPSYEYGGKGAEVLEYSFLQMAIQTYQDFDVVISDHSKDDEIKNLCDRWSKTLDIKYFRNEEKRGSASANTNSAIQKCTGKFIKILCADDYLYNANSLQNIVNELDEDTIWLASNYVHTTNRKKYYGLYIPHIGPLMMVNNTIGTPSAVTIRNMVNMPEMDESLSYCYDCDYYYRMIQKYGNPKFLNTVTMVNYIWTNSVSSMISQEKIDEESKYILKKYGVLAKRGYELKLMEKHD